MSFQNFWLNRKWFIDILVEEVKPEALEKLGLKHRQN